MPLFSPLGYTDYGGSLFGVDLGVDDPAARRPLMFPNGLLYQPAQQTAPAPAAPAVSGTASASPPPPLQSIGTFTTRRTQLFGPLSAVSI